MLLWETIIISLLLLLISFLVTALYVTVTESEPTKRKILLWFFFWPIMIPLIFLMLTFWLLWEAGKEITQAWCKT